MTVKIVDDVEEARAQLILHDRVTLVPRDEPRDMLTAADPPTIDVEPIDQCAHVVTICMTCAPEWLTDYFMLVDE